MALPLLTATAAKEPAPQAEPACRVAAAVQRPTTTQRLRAVETVLAGRWEGSGGGGGLGAIRYDGDALECLRARIRDVRDSASVAGQCGDASEAVTERAAEGDDVAALVGDNAGQPEDDGKERTDACCAVEPEEVWWWEECARLATQLEQLNSDRDTHNS
jgi:hypothetical protein